MGNPGASHATAIARLEAEIDAIHEEIRRIEKGGRGCVLSLIAALLIAVLVMRFSMREPLAMAGGGVMILLSLGVIYFLAQRANRQSIGALRQEIKAREQEIAQHRRIVAASPLTAQAVESVLHEPGAAQCPYCHATLTPDDIAGGKCPHCASAFKFTCNRCGTPVAEHATACPSCGAIFATGN
jgi:Zn finger protein HypA/HybF involved in hydrogenase expression